jgi:hypothetical protein
MPELPKIDIEAQTCQLRKQVIRFALSLIGIQVTLDNPNQKSASRNGQQWVW